MKVNKYSILILILGAVLLSSCKKDQPTFSGNHDPDVIITYSNREPVPKMDSVTSVNVITKQKLTEIYELSSLFAERKNDSLMMDILYPQVQSYFLTEDSVNVNNLLHEIDSLRAFYVEIRNLNTPQEDSLIPDSVRRINYNVRYFSKDKSLIQSLPKTAKYILKKDPKKFKKEFVFYFTEVNQSPEVKDTISESVTQ